MDPVYWRTILLTLVAVVGATLGDTFLSHGMRQIGQPESAQLRLVLGFFWRAFTSPWVIGGIGCLAIYFFTWLTVLSEADLSLVLPLTALTFIFAAVLARFWLGEQVSGLRWAGTMVIALGVVMVALTGKDKVSSVPPQMPPMSSPLPQAHP